MRVTVQVPASVDEVLNPVLAVLGRLPEVQVVDAPGPPGATTLATPLPPSDLHLRLDVPPAEIASDTIHLVPASWCASAVLCLGPRISTTTADPQEAALAWVGAPGDPLRRAPAARNPLAAHRRRHPGPHWFIDAGREPPVRPALREAQQEAQQEAQLHILDRCAGAPVAGVHAWKVSPDTVPSLLLASDGVIADDGPLAWDALRLGLPLAPLSVGHRHRHPSAAILPAGAALDPAVWRVLLAALNATHAPLDLTTVIRDLPWWDHPPPGPRGPRALRLLHKLVADPRQFLRDSWLSRAMPRRPKP